MNEVRQIPTPEQELPNPNVVLRDTLAQILPGEYQPDAPAQTETLYIDADRRHTLIATNAAGRYQLTEKNKGNTHTFWVMKGSDLTSEMYSTPDLPHAITPDFSTSSAVISTYLNGLLEKASTEKPQGRVARLAGKVSVARSQK